MWLFRTAGRRLPPACLPSSSNASNFADLPQANTRSIITGGRPNKPVRRRFTALIGQRCAAREEINTSIETVIGTVGRLPNDRDLAAPCRPVSARGEFRSSINCGWMSPSGSANQLASTWRSPRILGPLVISGSAGRRPRPRAEDKKRSRR